MLLELRALSVHLKIEKMLAKIRSRLVSTKMAQRNTTAAAGLQIEKKAFTHIKITEYSIPIVGLLSRSNPKYGIDLTGESLLRTEKLRAAAVLAAAISPAKYGVLQVLHGMMCSRNFVCKIAAATRSYSVRGIDFAM